MVSQMMRWPPLLLRVQPNPASALISLQSSEMLEDVAITLTDVLGNVCLQQSGAIRSDIPYELPIASLPAGLYGLVVRAGPRVVRTNVLHLR
jgi:hypothetical protein